MEGLRRFTCVGKDRMYDGSIVGYRLIEFGDEEERVKSYSTEYIINGIKRRQMVISNLRLNADHTGLVFLDRSQLKVVRDKDISPQTEEFLSDKGENTSDEKKSKNKPFKRKYHHAKHTSKKKGSKRR